MDINNYLRLRHVNRLGQEYITRPYNLMEHQYMVTVLFMHFAKKEGVSYDTHTLDKILHHDILEIRTGDLSYLVKNRNTRTRTAWAAIEEEIARDNPELLPYTDESIAQWLTGAQAELFKACDLLELWIFCKQEWLTGNRTPEIVAIIDRCYGLIVGKFNSIDSFMRTFKYQG